MAVVITTASQICRGVTGNHMKTRARVDPVSGISGMSGRTTPAIARNLQAVTTSPVSSRSVNCLMRPFECSTNRIEMAISTRYQLGKCRAMGPVAYVSRAIRTPIIPGLFFCRTLFP